MHRPPGDGGPDTASAGSSGRRSRRSRAGPPEHLRRFDDRPRPRQRLPRLDQRRLRLHADKLRPDEHAGAPYILLDGRVVSDDVTKLLEDGPRTGISQTNFQLNGCNMTAHLYCFQDALAENAI